MHSFGLIPASIHPYWIDFLSCFNFSKLFTTQIICNELTVDMSRSFSSFNPFPNKPWFFICLLYKSFENTVGKGENACNKQFLLFPQCFLPGWRTFCHFYQIRNCRLQSLSVLKNIRFVVWERVKASIKGRMIF